jgi:predicted ATP-dependent endonuclease of OLD family
MPRVLLTRLQISNFGPIKKDDVIFEPFTYFVGRNNAGKSHYLRATEVLLATKAPPKADIAKLQNDTSKPITIIGHFRGVKDYTSLVAASNHKRAIEEAIQNDVLRVVRILDPDNDDESAFGIYKSDQTIHNPGGFSSNLLKVLPETISILATADTADELKNTQNTALSKLKKEALSAFFEELKVKTRETITTLDTFLHGGGEERSKSLASFETHLKEELMGEFADVVPSVEFDLPNEEVIAKEMKILLDDGYKSEVEQKGHGLQRATLLALLKVLAKHGARYQDRPSPIFLIGEIESFLHPHAQKQLAAVLNSLVQQYQVITSTHSPFIVSPQAIAGYRRVRKTDIDGTKAIILPPESIDHNLIARHLERRGNLEGLFADRIILIEGTHDDGFYEKLRGIFGVETPSEHYSIFIKAGGKD